MANNILTNKNIYISPSILAADFGNMTGAVADAALWGADFIHCDVMDGVYVPNITFGMPMITALKRTSSLPLDVHLMITKPEKYADRFIEAGADILTFHPDASDCPLVLLRAIRSKGIKAGIVFNPNVNIDEYAHLIPECDIVLVMSVYAGFGGQAFIPSTLDKVRKIKKIIDDLQKDISIEIDGGISVANASFVYEAGANVIVAGSAIFNAKDQMSALLGIRLAAK